jgi:hypothetical protein
MADRIERTRSEAADWPTDSSVWSAVRYLDSSTDYREYLPPSGRPGNRQTSEFVTLDDGRSVCGKVWITTLAALFAGMILLLWLRS